jgi:hypothetical protein
LVFLVYEKVRQHVVTDHDAYVAMRVVGRILRQRLPWEPTDRRGDSAKKNANYSRMRTRRPTPAMPRPTKKTSNTKNSLLVFLFLFLLEFLVFLILFGHTKTTTGTTARSADATA